MGISKEHIDSVQISAICDDCRCQRVTTVALDNALDKSFHERFSSATVDDWVWSASEQCFVPEDWVFFENKHILCRKCVAKRITAEVRSRRKVEKEPEAAIISISTNTAEGNRKRLHVEVFREKCVSVYINGNKCDIELKHINDGSGYKDL